MILTVHRETLTQYITFKRGGRGESLLLYSLAIETYCIDPSVRIVTKSPKVRPLLIFSIYLCTPQQSLTAMPESGFTLGIGVQAGMDQDRALAVVDCVKTVQFK
jgi:hypothetical protein